MSVKAVLDAVSARAPFNLLDGDALNALFEGSVIEKIKPGQRLYSEESIPSSISFVLSGKFRIIAFDKYKNRNFTLVKYGAGRLIGWSSILNAQPYDYSLCCEEGQILRISSKNFLDSYLAYPNFASFFNEKISDQESYFAISACLNSQKLIEFSIGKVFNQLKKNIVLDVVSLSSFFNSKEESNLKDLVVPELDSNFSWVLTSSFLESASAGSLLQRGQHHRTSSIPKVPLRLVGVPHTLLADLDTHLPQSLAQNERPHAQENSSNLEPSLNDESFSLEELGIVEYDRKNINDVYPFFSGKSKSQKVLAICQMLSAFDNVPFRKDAIQKVLDDYLRRDKEYSLQMFGGLLELIGYRCLIGSTSVNNLKSLDFPAIIFVDDNPIILFGKFQNNLVVADPSFSRLQENAFTDFIESIKTDTISFLLPRKTASTPDKKLTWSWFVPLINKYKNSLVLVFAASLLAQLFGLAIPLMIQQIIDKVLTQGNLGSLNLLGSTMIVLALFQGFLTALRTFIFVDTTDRMDLTLGSSVIQKLLSLPLGYFDKRPVGELSQRLGELNTIRGFLTGTALVSSLNIIFALIYLIVMFLYSPTLSLIALSTIPIYIVLVFVVSPIFKSFIRNRAVAQARTQSHLIEVLNGIQTVKAQHFELTARWKWQDKYRHFVDQGFKSSILGTTTGEIGKFLNTISSLLVLWFGMWLVIDGEMTLGMLIAFRIISGNVTGPLLQLSGLYQSFQSVQLSMERLSDVIDQKPELESSTNEVGKIILPPIEGKVEFRDVFFRFKERGSYQLDGVSLVVNSGQFVGIVGQSGSGKSTLMKLLPKLYNPENGQVLIDGYDVDKIDLASLRRQVGIVPQDSILFEGTIAENIALNDPNASTEAIMNAAKIACAHDFIMELDEGYATPLAERGSNVSGGQRQRIAVARTILADPQLLILDEATSALDFNTERLLCENLYHWAGDKTVFFITHRLSTIKNSDKIIVMNKGQVCEEGQHDHLMSLQGRYFALYQQQQSS